MKARIYIVATIIRVKKGPSKRTLLLEFAPQGTVHEIFPSHGSDFLKASVSPGFSEVIFWHNVRLAKYSRKQDHKEKRRPLFSHVA